MLSAQQETLMVDGLSVQKSERDGSGYFTQTIPFREAAAIQVKLVNVEEELVTKTDVKPVYGSTFEPDFFLAKERGVPHLSIQIPLYRKFKNEVYALKKYKVEISFTPEESYVSKPTGTDNSVLQFGDWYKIAVNKRGVYKIDYQFLQNMGIDPAQINPQKIRIYGNGGTVLPEYVNSSVPDDLIENAIFVSTNGTTFTANDYILFYANGPMLWRLNNSKNEFLHTNNYYEDKSYYFLNFDKGPGKRIENENAVGNASEIVTVFDDYKVIDIDSINVGKLGKVWWSHPMNSINSSSLTQNLALDLGGVSGPVTLSSHVGNKNDADGNLLRLRINGQLVETYNLQRQNNNYTYDAFSITTFQPNSSLLNIQLQYQPNGNGVAYLDYLRFNYKRPLKFANGQLPFRSLASLNVPDGEKVEYQITDANAQMKVWDITNPLKPIALSGNLSNNIFKFQREGFSLKEFIAFDGSQFLSPTYIGTVANQNLHALGNTDFLIITHESLLPAAERLANFHQQRNGLDVTIVDVHKIYNEFSSGGQDIAGIRNFIKMIYDKGQNSPSRLKNVLLLGAASYDYKDRLPQNTNLVPTFQTMESAYEVISFSSDDIFGLLDEGESMEFGLLDVGLGRIPARDLNEAMGVVDKIERYVSAESFGPWKNTVAFVADDKEGGEYGMNHLKDCETANAYFDSTGKLFNLYKIYEDAYPAIAGSGGVRYPAVNKAINNQIYLGTFLMSYSGHGSPTRWSHEAILTAADYNSWENKFKLPVIMTATCDFGRFDEPSMRSAGVNLLLNPNKGGIALVTTTQAVYASSNTKLTKNFIAQQFTPLADQSYYSLGEALMKAKNLSGSGANDHKFTLLGDPALKMQIPLNKVKTDSIFMENANGELVTTDTLRALGKYVIKGSVVDKNETLLSQMNGTIYITIFDKMATVQTVNTHPFTTPEFQVQNSIIARIKGKVVNGQFTAHFIVPKDINFNFGHGKISYYAHDEQIDANGMDDEITVGGFNPEAEDDNQAPLVEAFIDNDKFKQGGITGPNPLLFVKLFDENGINVSGNAPGHDLIAILDGDVQNPFVMNDYYQTEENDYQKGYVYFPLSNLSEGEHVVRVKAWDTYNNSGEGEVRFVVKNTEKGFIDDLYNYPNPVTDITHFHFQHNQKGVEMEVTLQIFNTSGALMHTIQKEMTPEGNSSELTWDASGADGGKLAKGVYPYRLIIKTEKGIRAVAYQKLVLLR